MVKPLDLFTDKASATKFLKTLGLKHPTFQVFLNNKPHKTFYSRKVIGEALQTLNIDHDKGAEVFVMVNQGNHIIHAPNKTCRSQKNVTRLTACFIDVDTCPLSTVQTYLKSIGLKPHLVVQTSPNRYHLYFLIEPLYCCHSIDTTPEQAEINLTQWKLTQEALAYLGDTERKPTGCDPTMTDHSRIMRLPGFYHRKDPQNPFLVTIAKQYDHPPYTLTELYTKTRANDLSGGSSSNGGTPEDKAYKMKSSIPEGNRHKELLSFIGHLSNKDLSPEEIEAATYGYLLTKFESPKPFLPSGDRNHEVKSILDYTLQQRELERLENSKTQSKAILTQSESDPFSLPDSFYTDAPGLIGTITKEIVDHARYPLPSFAFAAAIAAIGTLKAKAVTTSLDHAPSNYFLCLAPTGSGKNFAQEVLSNTFAKLGVGKLINQGIRSEKGIARFLENNDSHGLLMLDEAEHFFNSLTDKFSAPYIKACKPLLLEVYTGTNTASKTLGTVGDKKVAPIVLAFPRLNLIAHGVLSTLDSAFNKTSITDGLLQRFITVTDFRGRILNDAYSSLHSLNGNCFSDIETLVRKMRFSTEADFLASQELECSLNAEEDETKKLKLQSKLEELLSKPPSKRSKVPFSAKAKVLYEAYAAGLNASYNKELQRKSGLEGLYTRAAEQVGRLCAVACENEITALTVEYFIEFIDSRIKALKHFCLKSYNQGQLSKDMDYLLNVVAQLSRNSGFVTKSALYRSTKFRNSAELYSILKSCLDSGQIIEQFQHVKNSRKKATVYLISNIDDLSE